MINKATSSIVNGVKVDQLFETIDAIKKQPVMATIKLRASNKWIEGGHNRTTIHDFEGGGVRHEHRHPFVLDADEPPVLLGKDKAASPVEYLLTALAACLTTSIVYHAAAKGIEIQELESRVEGDIDLRGFLGLDKTIPKGYKSIRVKFKIKADVPEAQLEELVRLGPQYSPVFDTLTRAVDVEVGLDKEAHAQAA